MQFVWLLGLMITTSIVEVVGIGLLLPFLSVLINPEIVFRNEFAEPIIKILDLTNPKQLLFPISAGFIFMLLSSGFMRVILIWAQIRISHAVGADLSLNIFKKTLYQPYLVHISRNSSDVISAMTHKTNHAVSNIILPIFMLISSALICIFILALLLFINTEIALYLFIGLGVLYISIMKIVSKYLVSNGKKSNINQTRVLKILREALGGIRDVIIDGAQEVYYKNFRSSDLALRRAYANVQIIGGSPRYIIESLSAIIIVIFAFSLSNQKDSLINAIPVLGTLILGAQKILPLLQNIYYSITNIISGQPSLEESLVFLAQKVPKFLQEKKSQDLIVFNKSIQIENINFAYAKSKKIILNNISLKILKGEKIGFIGTSGCGKTTLLDVIMGLLAPNTGQISIDNRKITIANNFMWREHISHVSQTVFLSDATIKENIAFGVKLEEIDMIKVRKAAMQSQISQTIESWSDGYETKVGERGVRLSGGQRQRIGIARALYKQADVVVLDEATSALDNKTEAKVMETIENMNDKVTILIVAHRLTTLRNCKRIVELEDGVIKNIGSYKDIVLRAGKAL